ncbi:hypothetical protein GCM10023347_51530 [Streptomyces chumphonensis]|uniref:DUF4383 domain-containing protein n=1 Tax=Streptomyces chumphonensis TaxID=1214925 RepID=A0A927F3U7_9ACTN|nr:DUF4383 domain-containing protein [Streptomyces chumphonensis]MBD3934505.1 DUF4383 domain-containing protein [Streptomyces chumphonensis]
MRLQDELPVDHRLAVVYRYGAALSGLILLVFGILGFADRLAFFDTDGTRVAGLSSNGLLSLISVVFGVLLIVGAVVGGNFASTLNMTVGALFLLSGFVHLAILERSVNILAFRMPNVIFSFVMGLLILTFGMYGRVSGGLPHDNPYWKRRHPERADARPSRPTAGALTAGGPSRAATEAAPSDALPPATKGARRERSARREESGT